MKKAVIELKNIEKKYPIYSKIGKFLPPKKFMTAVSELSLDILEGETYGLVGESGCGKTTTGRSIMGLVKPEKGSIIYNGVDLTKLDEKEFRKFRKDIQFVFQDPLSSLNPRQRIGELMEEPLIIHNMGDKEYRRQRVMEILRRVGLNQEHYFRYPHELSGGQVQRLGIARALIIGPKLIVCDEPVSALDVSVQAQILNMLLEVQKEMNISLLFISHDMGVVRYMSNRIGVMYLGSLVEEAQTDMLFSEPLHPYTKALFSAVPNFSDKKNKQSLDGELPIRDDDFRGCVFHTRCPYAEEKCSIMSPELREVRSGHKVACHFVGTNKND